MSKQNMPDINDEKYIKIGLFVVFAVFIVIGVWSAFAELESGVPSGGQVVVESNKKTIQYLDGGIVEKIYVKDGDEVKKGDKLVKFNEIKSESELNSMLANYYDSLALRDRLTSQNNRESSISFSKELASLKTDKREKLEQRQRYIFDNETGYMKKEAIVANQKIDSFNKQIDSLTKVVGMKRTLLASYKDEVKEQSDLLKNGLVDKLKLVDAKRRINTIESDILSNEADIKKFTIAISSTKTQLQLDKEKFFADLNTKLSKTQASIGDMKARINNLRAKLSRTVIKSPVDGVVMNLAVHTIGAVVSQGKPIMEIVPDDAKLIIKAKLSPAYIDFVKVGSKANITFPSFQMKGRFIANIKGEVTFVSADSSTNKDGSSFYDIKLKITDDGKATLEKNKLSLLAGMPASITVKAGKQTALEYLLKPMSMMLDRAFLEQ